MLNNVHLLVDLEAIFFFINETSLFVKIFKSKYPCNFELQTSEQSFKGVDWRSWRTEKKSFSLSQMKFVSTEI